MDLQTGFADLVPEIPLPIPPQIGFDLRAELYDSACALAVDASGRKYAVFAGGRNERDFTVSEVYVYDIDAQLWTPGEDFVRNFANGYAVSYDGDVYVATNQDLRRFDGDSQTWERAFEYPGLFNVGVGSATLAPRSLISCDR